VCDPLGDPTVSDIVSVCIQQASGQTVSTCSGELSGVPFTMFNSPLFLTCDGTTQNAVVVSVLPEMRSPLIGTPTGQTPSLVVSSK
jgi:hypothetical protein